MSFLSYHPEAGGRAQCGKTIVTVLERRSYGDVWRYGSSHPGAFFTPCFRRLAVQQHGEKRKPGANVAEASDRETTWPVAARPSVYLG